MDQLFYAAFLIISSGLAGVSAFGLALSLRLSRRGPREKAEHLPRILVKTGFLITSGVLLYALVGQGATPTNWRSWVYLTGLVIAGTGIVLFTRDSVEELVQHELQVETGDTSANVLLHRLGDIERQLSHYGDRITTEEHRNDAVERAARVSKTRADEAEERENDRDP
jgi:hypothetical protein